LFLFIATITLATPVVPTQFTHLSVEDGLSQITVSDIVEDNIGFMWFSTQNGVNRFDGYNFVQYKKDKNLDGSGPIGDFIYKLAVDTNNGDVWTASSHGLSRYEHKSDRFIHYPLIDSEGQQHHFVATVVYDRTGQLWAGTNLGLFKFQETTDSFVHIKLNNNVNFRVQDIEQDINGVIWLATSQGLYGFKEDEPLYVVADLKNVEVTDIELIDHNKIWFSTNGKGIYVKYDTADLKHIIKPLTELSLKLSGQSISSLKQIRNGDIWISTLSGLTITQLKTNPVTISLKHNSDKSGLLSASHMTRTYESRSGLIWQGTWTSGFSRFDPSSMQFKTLNAGGSKTTRGVANDASGNIWFGTPEGLWKRDRDGETIGPMTFENEPTGPNFLEENSIISIAHADATNKIWVGTRSGLAYLADGQQYIKYVTDIRGSMVFTLSTDKVGDVWVGDFNNGLIYLDGITHEVKNQWKMGTITKILVDNDELIWASTMEGLIRVNKHTGELLNLYSPHRKASQRSPRVITWISKSQQEHYWIGAQGSGIITLSFDKQLQDFTFQQVAPESHLSTLSIGGIEQDTKGNVWASTTEGVAKLDANLANPVYFSGKNGAKNEGYYINNSLTNIDGEILFGSPTGVTYFQPENVAQSDWNPPIVFTKLLVLDKPISIRDSDGETFPLKSPIYQAKEVTLQTGDNVFSIEFSALDFSAPEKNQYAFKLEGFDTTWNTANSRKRVATYTNLDAGSYKLLVKGTNKDGVWSDQVGQITITIVPPWWLSTWAKILWLTTALALLMSVYRRRVYTLTRQSQLLSVQVEERTAELEMMNKKLLTLSTIDDLTGLRNRRDYRANALQESSRFERGGMPFCILLIDIDYFKKVNDINGHACGDKVLIQTGQLMSSLIRQQDLLARWGGEEFIMMIVETRIEQGQQIAEKIRLAIEKNIVEFRGQDICVSVTIGVSQILPEEKLDDCINRADKNLYLGKEDGRNKVIADT
jgi:diguanylate cyclase (GGDEF)-like protein